MKRLYGLLTLVGTLSLLGSLLGYVRNASITSVFGLSGESDAYFVALFIPATLQAILVLGALAPALVHVYVNYAEQGKQDDARVTFSSIVNLMVIALGALVTLGAIFSPFIVKSIAAGLPPESARLSVHLMHFTMPLLLLMCLAALLGPMLNTRDHFFSPALSSLVINVFTIAFVVVGSRTMGITAAAVGVLTGTAAHVAILLFFLRKKGISYSPVLRLGHPGVRRVLVRTAPVALYMGLAYCAPLWERQLASFMGQGSVSIITIAATVFAFPPNVFSSSLGVVLYPQLVREAATVREDFARSLKQGSRLILVVLAPVTLMMMVASMPLMRLAYGPGGASNADVHTSANVLAIYAIGLCALGLTQMVQNGIYAQGDFVTPLKVVVPALALYLVMAFGLSHLWSIAGLAAARACHQFLVMSLMFWMVRRLPEIPSLRWLGVFAVKPLLAAVTMAMFYLAASFSVSFAYPSPSYAVLLVEQCLLLLASGCVYLAGCVALGIHEVAVLRQMLPLSRPRWLIGSPVAVPSRPVVGGADGRE